MWNCLQGHAILISWDQSQGYGIVSRRRISSATWPSISKKHDNRLMNQSINQSIYIYISVCLFVCMWVLNCSGEYHVCLTVWYICTPVTCDSKYTLTTVRRLNDRHHNFACIFLHIEKCSYFSFMSFDTTVTFGMGMNLLKWSLS